MRVKEDILRLRAEGKTYRQIQEILKCSRSTISYHCGNTEGHMARCRERTRKSREKSKTKALHKVHEFISKDPYRIKNYRRTRVDGQITSSFSNITAVDVILKTEFCYLSGRPIDLANSASYHLDHKIPVSRGGKSTLSNMGVACAEVNKAKNNLTVDEFIQLCKDVLINFGYKISE